MKKLLRRGLPVLLAVLLAALCTLPVHAYTFSPEEDIHSDAAILYSMDADEILYEKNPDKPEQPGHLAQIMTALVVLDNCPEPDGAAITTDTGLFGPLIRYEEVDDLRYADIQGGDTLTVHEYLYALMLASSCEAAIILGSTYGNGSTDVFVEKMNEKAAEIGCTQTHFTNVTGLYDENQYTTARDMLTITRCALENPILNEIINTKSFSPKTPNPENHPVPENWEWVQSNSMTDEVSPYYYPGAVGIKTGNLNQSGRSLITMAQHEKSSCLVILLNAPFNDAEGNLQYYHMEDAAFLFNWAFSTFSYVTLLRADEEIAEVHVDNSSGNPYVLVRPAQDATFLWSSAVDTSAVQRITELKTDVQAPVYEGDELGTIRLVFSGETLAEMPLVATKNIDLSITSYYLYALKNYPHSPLFRYGFIAATVISLFYLLCCIIAYSLSRRRAVPEAPVHLIPQAEPYEDEPHERPDDSDAVYYHGEREDL